MITAWINKIRLSQFRNIDYFILEDIQKINGLYGENGVGKTNILDAIVRFTHNLGLKMQPAGACETLGKQGQGWQAEITIDTPFMPTLCKTGIIPQKGQKFLRYCGEKTNHAHLGRILPCLWTSPVNDKIFTENMLEIRHYFQQMMGLLFPEIFEIALLYTKGCKQRLKLLLQEQPPAMGWLCALEQEIACYAMDYAQKMQDFLKLFHNYQISTRPDFQDYFPDFSLDYHCETQNYHTVESYCETLQSMREADKIAKKTLFGIHRVKWLIIHKGKNVAIDYCSTGEQKSILLSILFIVNQMMIHQRELCPILLLDDVFAHFDKNKINFLADYLQKIPNQSFLTGTDFAFEENYAINKVAIETKHLQQALQPILF